MVDAGAGRGQLTLLAAGFWPHARIFAFKPLAGPFAVLARIAAARDRIQASRAAIGPRVECVHMHVMQPEDCSSLLAPTARQRATFPQSRLAGADPVETAPLEAVVGPGDLSAAQARRARLRARRLERYASSLDWFAAIYVAYSFVPLYAGQPLAAEVLEHLRAHGSRLTGVYKLAHDHEGRAVQSDLCCERY